MQLRMDTSHSHRVMGELVAYTGRIACRVASESARSSPAWTQKALDAAMHEAAPARI